MQVSNKALSVSAVSAGTMAAFTQAAPFAVTMPFPVAAATGQWLWPIIAAIVPLLISQFMPGLAPAWEWVKKIFPMQAEPAAYANAAKVMAPDPQCPLLRRKAKAMLDAAFEKYHPAVPADPSVILLPPGVPDAK